MITALDTKTTRKTGRQTRELTSASDCLSDLVITKMSLGLLAGAYDSSDDEEEVQKPEEKQPVEVLDNPFASSKAFSTIGLPKPAFRVEAEEKVNSGVKIKHSVFSNPFRDQEDKKRAILEKHVALTVKQEELRTIGGKKICWNFRKGRCRFGHNCTFAHDSDIKVGKFSSESDASAAAAAEEAASTSADPSASLHNPFAATKVKPVPKMFEPVAAPTTGLEYQYEQAAPPNPAEYDAGAVIAAEDTQGMMRKKKRPGLTSGLVPGKKAMKFHNKVYNSQVGQSEKKEQEKTEKPEDFRSNLYNLQRPVSTLYSNWKIQK